MNIESIIKNFTTQEKSSLLLTAADEDLLLSAVDMLFSNKVTNVAQAALLQRNVTKTSDGEVDTVTYWENRLGENKVTEPLNEYIDSVHDVAKGIGLSAETDGKKLWLSTGGAGDRIKLLPSIWLEAKRSENGISLSVWRNKFGSSGVVLDV